MDSVCFIRKTRIYNGRRIRKDEGKWTGLCSWLDERLQYLIKHKESQNIFTLEYGVRENNSPEKVSHINKILNRYSNSIVFE